MISEEQYLEYKKEFELANKNHEDFIVDNFYSLFFKFNDFFKDNDNFELDIKSISGSKLSGSINFSSYTKHPKWGVSTDRLYVNFEIKNEQMHLSYTEDNSQRPFSNMKQKSILYIEVINFFENFNIEQFSNLCDEYENSSKELSKTKRDFTKLEDEYFAALNLRYQKAFLTIVTQVDKDKVLEDFENFIKEQMEILDSNDKYKQFKEKKFEGFCYSFNLDEISFKNFSIKIQKNIKTNKPEFLLNYKKTSKKKCIEAITNQFYYKDKLVIDFRNFQLINAFPKNNFLNYSEYNCKAKIKILMNPFMANIIAQDF